MYKRQDITVSAAEAEKSTWDISTDVISQPDTSKSDNPFNVVQPNDTRESIAPVVPSHRSSEPSHRYTPLSMIVSFIGLILVTLGINVDRSRFAKLTKAFYNTNALKGLHRTRKGSITLQDVLLYVAFFVNVSLFAYLVLKDAPSSARYNSWGMIILALAGIYLLRHIFQNVLSYTFLFEDQSRLHGFSIMVHNLMVGIAVLPILIALQFGPENYQVFIYIGLIIIGLGYMLRQGKGLLLSTSIRGFNVMYFFIYLCAVEIAPILILLKELR